MDLLRKPRRGKEYSLFRAWIWGAILNALVLGGLGAERLLLLSRGKGFNRGDLSNDE